MLLLTQNWLDYKPGGFCGLRGVGVRESPKSGRALETYVLTRSFQPFSTDEYLDIGVYQTCL